MARRLVVIYAQNWLVFLLFNFPFIFINFQKSIRFVQCSFPYFNRLQMNDPLESEGIVIEKLKGVRGEEKEIK